MIFYIFFLRNEKKIKKMNHIFFLIGFLTCLYFFFLILGKHFRRYENFGLGCPYAIVISFWFRSSSYSMIFATKSRTCSSTSLESSSVVDMVQEEELRCILGC